jgi:hypothetical protein
MVSSYTKRLTLEVAIIAVFTAIALALWVTLNGPIRTKSSAFFTGLVIGAGIHIAFELFGGNAYYCSSGAACRT